ncbi:MAG: putative oxidoreductase [Anaerolineaceae bacterium]|nr:MAG: putative oxidoreductase [Anaerolineaceae bacterium]
MKSELSLKGARGLKGLTWQGEKGSVCFSGADIHRALLNLEETIWAVEDQEKIGLATGGKACSDKDGVNILGMTPASPLELFGDREFCKTYGTQYAYYAGAMANGISSENLVITLGKGGWMGSFGAGGLSPARIESAIQKIREALPDGPYLFNLLNSPNEPALEERTVALYLKHGVRVLEASAYLAMTAPLVHYRAAGLSRAANGAPVIGNRMIAKLSRLEMAQRFLEPAPADLLSRLVEEKKITPLQAELARQVPMADDITVEADSGGHTDNRPLVCMIPAFLALRDAMQEKHHYAQPVRIGAAGGIGTPDAALAAFMLGVAYIVTGSVNQACVESGASEHTRKLLAEMEMADVAMAPAGDMFEMGARVQVIKRGTMFAMRAQKLYELYTRYNAWEEIPQAERDKLEKTVFKRDFGSIWNDTVKFFMERDPRQVERGNANPKDKMALVFRWYLGLSSHWSASGEKGREMDYQIWTGPAMGAFNNWVKGTYLENPRNRRVVDVAKHILRGCAYLYRVRSLEMQGIVFPEAVRRYIPEQASS